MHTLSSSSRHSRPQSREASLDEKREGLHRRRRSSYSPDSPGSDFSLWSDTGDLVDQLAEEDPLRPRAPGQSIDSARGNRGQGRAQRRVHYADDETGEKHTFGGAPRNKEDIPIPNFQRRPANKGQRLLAAIMAPNDGPSRVHGLHGKKLMYGRLYLLDIIHVHASFADLSTDTLPVFLSRWVW